MSIGHGASSCADARVFGGGVRLAFGEAADGRAVHIGDVRSGLRCGCVCPHCGAPLVARRGPLREHHFGHHVGTTCAFAAETALDKLAKQVFSKVGRLMLPPAVAEVGDLRTEVSPAREVAIDAVAIERRLGAVVPDVICTVRGRDLLVEVAVTHRCPPEKIDRLRVLGLPAIEIELSPSAIDRGFASVVEAIVRAAPRRWLHNARIEQACQSLEIAGRRRSLRQRDHRAAQADAIVAVLGRLGIAGIIDPVLCAFIDDALAEEVRNRVPSFASPFRVVEAYLDFLARADIVVRLGRCWSVSRVARRNAARIATAAASQLPNE